MSTLNITKNNFDEAVLSSDIPVVVDFWAEWCGPCKIMGPIFEQLSEEYDGKIKFCKLDVDENGELAAQYNVMGIPTMILYKDGGEAERIVGSRPADEVADFLDKHI
ncbi:MAG: thioredoxin [Oscillospiraceae bacterium]|nr:thioredoxin [Oscillospiraceae bacterium]